MKTEAQTSFFLPGPGFSVSISDQWRADNRTATVVKSLSAVVKPFDRPRCVEVSHPGPLPWFMPPSCCCGNGSLISHLPTSAT